MSRRSQYTLTADVARPRSASSFRIPNFFNIRSKNPPGHIFSSISCAAASTAKESRRFVGLILSGQKTDFSAAENAELFSNIKRLHLFAKDESPLLVSILKKTLKKAWFFNMGISSEKLTSTDQIQIEYILSGFPSIIGTGEVLQNPSALKAFPHTPVGRAAIGTLKEIAAGQR